MSEMAMLLHRSTISGSFTESFRAAKTKLDSGKNRLIDPNMILLLILNI